MYPTVMVAIMAAAFLVEWHNPVDAPQIWPHTLIGDAPSKNGDRLCQDVRAFLQITGSDAIGTGGTIHA